MAVVEESLADSASRALGCPVLDQAIASYRRRDAGQLERARHRFAPETRASRSADEAMELICTRVATSVRRWAATGEISGVPPDALLSVGEGLPPDGTPSDGGPRIDRRLAELGTGRRLDGRTRERFAESFGDVVDRVRIHDGPAGGAVAGEEAARALTVGEHIAFAAGEFAPGTPAGDALLAHELAHDSQQRSAVGIDREPAGDADLGAERNAQPLERSGGSGSGRGLGSGRSARRRSRGCAAASGLRCPAHTAPVRAPAAPAGPTDQHAGLQLPDADAQKKIFDQLFPSMTLAPGPAPPAGGGPVPVPVRIPWDGAADPAGVISAPAAAARTKLKTDLLAELNAQLTAVKALIAGRAAAYAADKIPMSSFEGAGKGAQRVVERRFGAIAEAAARTPAQAATRHGFAFKGSGPGQNLRDAFDPADRAAVGVPVAAMSVLRWMAQRDKALAVRAPTTSRGRTTRSGRGSSTRSSRRCRPARGRRSSRTSTGSASPSPRPPTRSSSPPCAMRASPRRRPAAEGARRPSAPRCGTPS